MSNIHYLNKDLKPTDPSVFVQNGDLIHAFTMAYNGVSLSLRKNGYVEVLDVRIADAANGSRHALPQTLTEGVVGGHVAALIYNAICFSDPVTGETTLKRPMSLFSQFSTNVETPFLQYRDAADQPQTITALKVTAMKREALSIAA